MADQARTEDSPEQIARSDGRGVDEGVLMVVEQITNAALREVGLPERFHLTFEDDGIAWFDGDADPGDEWDEAIERALSLAWGRVGMVP